MSNARSHGIASLLRSLHIRQNARFTHENLLPHALNNQPLSLGGSGKAYGLVAEHLERFVWKSAQLEGPSHESVQGRLVAGAAGGGSAPRKPVAELDFQGSEGFEDVHAR